MNSIDTLERIFGSVAKVKIMRLFLFNPNTSFDSKDVKGRVNTNSQAVRREMALLEKIGMVKKKHYTKTAALRNGKVTKHKVQGWILNRRFKYLKPLQSFLVDMHLFTPEDVTERFKKVGKIKLLLVSGVFIQEWESRVDILIVGDKLKTGVLKNVMKNLESEVGKELTYASFETDDFLYRVQMFDKLVRDVLDFPHEKIVDKFNIS